jgi:lysozyme family protein
MDKVTDDMLEREMVVNVNVGMGNTDPVTKLQKFLAGVQAFAAVAAAPPPGMNLSEVWKEIAALSGYADGERFTLGQDPEHVKLQQQNQQLMAAMQKLMAERKDKSEANAVKTDTNRENNIVKLLMADKEDMHQNLQMYAKHLAMKDMAEHQQSMAPSGQPQGQPQGQPMQAMPAALSPAQAMPGQGMPTSEQMANYS